MFKRQKQLRSLKKGVLKNLAKVTEKHLSQGLIFNKVAGLRPEIAFRHSYSPRAASAWQRCFPVNIPAKFLRTPFLQNTSGRLLLKLSFFLFFSLSFSSCGNYQLNWRCEYMKHNSWKFLQISCRFLKAQ